MNMIKRLKLHTLWLAFFLMLLFLSPSLRAQETITLEQCYELARTNYPLIKRYGLIEQAEKYSLSNAGKGWLPQLSVSAKASYQSDVTKLPFDSEAISALIPGFDIPVMSKDQYQIVAELNQTIWDGGTISSVRELSKAEANVNREQLEADLYALNERVNQLYFGCLLQDELLVQNDLLQKDLQLNIDRIGAMITNGVANQSDRESMEVELLNAKQKRIELMASRDAYRQMLGVLIGKSSGNLDLQMPSVIPQALSAEINRPELRLFDAQQSLLEVQNKQINAGLMPKLGAYVQGGYGRPGLNMLEDSFEPYYVAGVRLSWNIGKLYTMKNDRRKLSTNINNVELQKDVFLFNLRLQLLQQQTEIQKVNDLMRSDEEIIRLRSSIKKAAEVKLENGVISVTDFIREINAEDMAKQSAASHKIQHLMAIYNYMYSTNNK